MEKETVMERDTARKKESEEKEFGHLPSIDDTQQHHVIVWQPLQSEVEHGALLPGDLKYLHPLQSWHLSEMFSTKTVGAPKVDVVSSDGCNQATQNCRSVFLSQQPFPLGPNTVLSIRE